MNTLDKLLSGQCKEDFLKHYFKTLTDVISIDELEDMLITRDEISLIAIIVDFLDSNEYFIEIFKPSFFVPHLNGSRAYEEGQTFDGRTKATAQAIKIANKSYNDTRGNK